MENPVIIFGANPLGRTAKEIFESNNVVVYGFLDDNAKLHSTEIDNVVVPIKFEIARNKHDSNFWAFETQRTRAFKLKIGRAHV